MLRLKGQTESGEWVEFGLDDVSTINIKTTWFGDCGIKYIDPATIRPVEDPQTPTRIKCSNCGQCFDTDIVDVFARCDNCQTEIAISSQPADDPRKAVLAEIRKRLGYVQMVEDKVNGWGGYSEDEVDAILNEMETRL